jgi:NAD(P)H-flavin reductase
MLGVIMTERARRKRVKLPLQSDFAEDQPGQFLKAQVTRVLNESYYTSSDQEAVHEAKLSSLETSEFWGGEFEEVYVVLASMHLQSGL